MKKSTFLAIFGLGFFAAVFSYQGWMLPSPQIDVARWIGVMILLFGAWYLGYDMGLKDGKRIKAGESQF